MVPKRATQGSEGAIGSWSGDRAPNDEQEPREQLNVNTAPQKFELAGAPTASRVPDAETAIDSPISPTKSIGDGGLTRYEHAEEQE